MRKSFADILNNAQFNIETEYYRLKNSDNIHADILFNMINEKAEKLDIVFLYGHNHSENYAEAYPDGGSVNFFAPGDTIRIPNGQVAASGA